MLIPRNEFDPAPIPPALAVAIAIAGLAGIIGGVATFRGSRAWGRLSYLFAGLLLLALPIGTIISLLWFVSSSRYWKVRERMREIEAGNA